jgi:predicted esterase
MRTLALLAILALGCSGTIDGAPEERSTPDDTGASAETAAEDAGTEDTASSVDTETADTGTTSVDTGTMMETTPDTAIDTEPPGPSSTRQTAKPLGTDGAPRGYYEYLPPSYGKAKSPLLLFFHGIGENGNGTTELSKVLAAGPAMLIAKDRWPATRPFVVLSSQNASGCPSAEGVKTFLEYALDKYSIDPARIYITGLSCGAIGTWNYLRANVATTPVAAVVPIAGDGRGAWDTNKCGLGAVAIWGFHGDKDGTVAPAGTEVPMTNLIACTSRRAAKLTMYPDVGHDSWSRTYDLSAGHDIYQWLLDNHR